MTSYTRNPELLALYRRATAAQMLADRGELDGEVALSYVVWPTPAIVQAAAVGMQESDRGGPDREYET